MKHPRVGLLQTPREYPFDNLREELGIYKVPVKEYGVYKVSGEEH